MCYFLAKEGLSFEKYNPLCELESRHQVEIGNAYRTAPAARQFTHYIALAQRKQFLQDLSSKKFYSFLMDGSTDSAKIEQELIVILTFVKDDVVEEVRSHARFFALSSPESADAHGLVKCLSQALSPVICGDDVLEQENVLGNDTKPALVGGGTDGASVNVGEQNGMRGMMLRASPWLMWSWCFAHRLELACKSALSSKLFKDIEEMLLRLYYLYEKSPKKVRELMDIVTDLKEVFELPSGGNIPVRSHGSRWIGHKRKALLRVLDRYGAYMTHLIALTEDTSVKPEDRACLKGYLRKWMQYKVLLGCALYADILKPASMLSLSLQNKAVDTVLGIKNILKAVTALNSLSKLDCSEWPTVKLFLGRLKEEDGQVTYQGAELQNSGPKVKTTCKRYALNDLKLLDGNLQERLAWSDKNLLRALLVFLETQTWTKRGCASSADSLLQEDIDQDDPSIAEVKEAVEVISTHFRIPLEAKGLSFVTLQDEIEEVIEYARKYTNIGAVEYRKIWYKLFSCPDSHKWPNVLMLCELAFNSNGRVEQIFSSMKVLKTDRRTNMQSDTLNDIMEIYVEGPPLSSFSPDNAIQLWWNDCATSRRVN